MVDKSLDELVAQGRKTGGGGGKGGGRRRNGGGGGTSLGAGKSSEAKSCPWTTEKTSEGVKDLMHWLHDDRTGKLPGEDGDTPWEGFRRKKGGGKSAGKSSGKGRGRRYDDSEDEDEWESPGYGPSRGGKGGRSRSDPYSSGKGGRRAGGGGGSAEGKWKHDKFAFEDDYDEWESRGRKGRGKAGGKRRGGGGAPSWDMHDDRW
eukprot:TRINITY_DN19958_c0_g1_i1.p2 TRINITY_DN19958_c0_g1~~TRINITY_DN19958_c0_g1_i1.p2  ORF type:complete len:204 (+),score=61.63 TRINITY_DN19958_c0_g1_i1:196-807(+)